MLLYLKFDKKGREGALKAGQEEMTSPCLASPGAIWTFKLRVNSEGTLVTPTVWVLRRRKPFETLTQQQGGRRVLSSERDTGTAEDESEKSTSLKSLAGTGEGLSFT